MSHSTCSVLIDVAHPSSKPPTWRLNSRCPTFWLRRNDSINLSLIKTLLIMQVWLKNLKMSQTSSMARKIMSKGYTGSPTGMFHHKTCYGQMSITWPGNSWICKIASVAFQSSPCSCRTRPGRKQLWSRAKQHHISSCRLWISTLWGGKPLLPQASTASMCSRFSSRTVLKPTPNPVSRLNSFRLTIGWAAPLFNHNQLHSSILNIL